ncbi:hypothetical protein CA12_27240 [Alienimonas californiensis]|uniref:Uncharacterized protein n=1 Tax=Alienimonas californiensis TaxID=2527989 RepID=A0A517PB75_9PLAN|nr:hypothetical protein CA12_27240 [Alienimonas californiensis]
MIPHAITRRVDVGKVETGGTDDAPPAAGQDGCVRPSHRHVLAKQQFRSRANRPAGRDQARRRDRRSPRTGPPCPRKTCVACVDADPHDHGAQSRESTTRPVRPPRPAAKTSRRRGRRTRRSLDERGHLVGLTIAEELSRPPASEAIDGRKERAAGRNLPRFGGSRPARVRAGRDHCSASGRFAAPIRGTVPLWRPCRRRPALDRRMSEPPPAFALQSSDVVGLPIRGRTR